MKAHTGASRRGHRALRPPRVVVEETVSSLVGPKLVEWLDELGGAIGRVLDNADTEAEHDLRVTLRRSRSLLRIVRPVYGRFHVNLIRGEYARVADATGALRDEEVLAETLDALELDDEARSSLEAWKRKRRHRMRALRTSVTRLLAAGSLQPPTEHLQALLKLPCDPELDKEVRRFARQVVLEAQGYVEHCRTAEITDVAGMHALRIAYKRLRYAIEAFHNVLPPELRAWKDVASKFQSVLGHLHDHDVAIELLGKASAVPPDARASIVDALTRRREELASRYVHMSGGEAIGEA